MKNNSGKKKTDLPKRELSPRLPFKQLEKKKKKDRYTVGCCPSFFIMFISVCYTWESPVFQVFFLF